jgi:transcription initiation factor TFIID subunit 8
MDIQGGFNQNARRKVLNAAVSVMVHEAGFGSARESVLETLVEMIQALLSELGRSSRAFAELAGRTDALVGDVVLALVEMGLDVDSIPAYGRTLLRQGTKIIIPAPNQAAKANVPKILQAGEKKSLLAYIPDHYPPFPDPHSYIRTPTHKQPVTEYEAIREKAATQKRDVERALTRFMAKTSDPSSAHNLFPDEHMSTLFPLITLKLQPNAYLGALLPKDQIFEEDETEEEMAKDAIAEKELKKDGLDELMDTSGNDGVDGEVQSDEVVVKEEPVPLEVEVPDNPYLRPAKIAKERKRRY